MIKNYGEITLRDYFAAKAMQHILKQTYDYEESSETHLARSLNGAKDAYVIADAMLKAREIKK
jgi:hypothetical protein